MTYGVVLNALGKPSSIDAAKALARVLRGSRWRAWFVVRRKSGKGREAVTVEPARPAHAENIIQVIEVSS